MPAQNEFKHAKRYRAEDRKSPMQKYTPLLTGSLFLFIGINYLFFAIRSLSKGNVFCFGVSLLIFAAFVGAFVMLRRGIALEKIYQHAGHARAPKMPLKTLAGSLLSSATFASAYFLGGYGLFASAALGLSVLLGWYLYYGFDPRKDKLEGFESDRSAERILTLLIKAREDVEAIRKAAFRLGDADVRHAMLQMADGFERIVKHIESEPSDYERARTYLISYLSELRKMGDTYSKLEQQGHAASMREDFLNALHQTAEKLDSQYDKLLDDDKLNLDIQIEVLKKRLYSE